MARIFRHPEVEDYFHELDLQQDPATLARRATELYESGQVIVLKDYRVDFDAELLANLEFTEKTTKKFKSITFLEQHRALSTAKGELPDSYGELLRTAFRGDKSRLGAFAEQVHKVNAQVDALAARLFPHYRIEKSSVTWRLNETVNENLHVDAYREELPNHHLRLFVNLDSVPRIWHTSHTLEHVLATSLHLLGEEALRTSPPGRICRDLNLAFFKGWELAGREGQPKHIVFFEPGEVWLVDSRKVSHQIFFGRKALSTEHAVANDSMSNPSAHYFALVERHRDRLLGHANAGVA